MAKRDYTKFSNHVEEEKVEEVADMFEPTGDPEDDYAFMEENCFIISEEETEYFDPNIPDVFPVPGAICVPPVAAVP